MTYIKSFFRSNKMEEQQLIIFAALKVYEELNASLPITADTMQMQ